MAKKILERAGEFTQEQLAARLHLARRSAGFNAEELARRLGVTAKTVRAWERGKREPRANQLQMIAGVLNVTTPWLLEGREQEFMDIDKDAAILRGKLEAARSRLAEVTDLLAEIEERLPPDNQ